MEKYFEDIKVEKKLRIIPVGGAGEIKRIYNHIIAAYEDFKKEVKGKEVRQIEVTNVSNSGSDSDESYPKYEIRKGLRFVKPYRHQFTTHVKAPRSAPNITKEPL